MILVREKNGEKGEMMYLGKNIILEKKGLGKNIYIFRTFFVVNYLLKIYIIYKGTEVGDFGEENQIFKK